MGPPLTALKLSPQEAVGPQELHKSTADGHVTPWNSDPSRDVLPLGTCVSNARFPVTLAHQDHSPEHCEQQTTSHMLKRGFGYSLCFYRTGLWETMT